MKKKIRKKMFRLTNSGVSGAAIAPNRPIIEHKFISVLRMLVGQISAVKMYSIQNAIEIDSMPIKNSARVRNVCSIGT